LAQTDAGQGAAEYKGLRSMRACMWL
jgi:hypothetical protein